MKKENIIRILVADDEPIIRRSICKTIRSIPQFFLAADVSSGAGAVKFIEEHPFDVDVILMDIAMDSADDGLLAAKKIYEINPEIIVIMLTVLEDEHTIFKAYCIDSIKDYVVKSFDNHEIVAAIQRSFQDYHHSSSANQKLRSEFKRLKQSEHSLFMAVRILSQMTPSEKEIIILKLDGLSTRQIAKKRMVEESTIKSQINTMLKKLGFTKSSQIIKLIRELKLEELFKD
ncbi:MAG TPA: response regulator transcription factor [Clostridiales bacterium]|jgi:NarL family two-component system response regulator LiaR|nr:response regulator transcription factor [Clostridiales bacterium]